MVRVMLGRFDSQGRHDSGECRSGYPYADLLNSDDKLAGQYCTQ